MPPPRARQATTVNVLSSPMDIATIAIQRKSRNAASADPTPGTSDAPAGLEKKKIDLSDAVRMHLARKKWLKEWEKLDSKGAIAHIVTSLVKAAPPGEKISMWSSIVDAAIAAVPPPSSGHQVVDCRPPFQGRCKITKDELKAAIEAPTTEGRWFTPTHGWPRNVTYAGGRPADLMHTVDTAEPGFFLPDGEALGELRIELLECDGLPTMDLGAWDENDIYALVVFEDTVARTQVIQDVDNPCWHSECARGFNLPIHSASSALHLALFDSDEDAALNKLSGGLSRGLSNLKDGVDGISPGRGSGSGAAGSSGAADSSRSSKDGHGSAAGGGAVGGSKAAGDDDGDMQMDDPIGRVVIEPRRLVPGTTYDSWFELRRSAALDDAGQFGAVRLRHSS